MIWSVSGWNTGEQMVWVRCLASVKGYTFLHLGKLIPDGADVATRNEGMGILLDERATAAWRQGGEVWEAINSRTVMARPKWMGKRQS